MSLEMHREAAIVRVSRCNWRPGLSKIREAHGGHDRASLEKQFKTKIE